MQQFDPNIPGLIEGNITTVVVIDPTGTFPPFEVGNHVLNRNDSFQINVEWSHRPAQAALVVRPRRQLERPGLRRVPRRWPRRFSWPATTAWQLTRTVRTTPYKLTVPPTALAEGDPAANTSGIYKLVVSVFLNSNLGNPGFDMTGFNEGPIIQVEDPV